MKTDLNHERWVDFGIISDACLVQPVTCEPGGAAVALWAKLVNCPWQGGIISSQTAGKTGFQIICYTTDIK